MMELITIIFKYDNICSCLPDNPLVCESKCVIKYFNPLYPTKLILQMTK